MRTRVKGAELFCSTRGEGPACLWLSGIGTKPYELQTPPELSDRSGNQMSQEEVVLKRSALSAPPEDVGVLDDGRNTDEILTKY